jgi:hypothetical protein
MSGVKEKAVGAAVRTKSLSSNSLDLSERNKGAGKHKQAQIIFSLLFIPD